MTDLIKNIQNWVSDRNLNTQDPRIQMCKTVGGIGRAWRTLSIKEQSGRYGRNR